MAAKFQKKASNPRIKVSQAGAEEETIRNSCDICHIALWRCANHQMTHQHFSFQKRQVRLRMAFARGVSKSLHRFFVRDEGIAQGAGFTLESAAKKWATVKTDEAALVRDFSQA